MNLEILDNWSYLHLDPINACGLEGIFGLRNTPLFIK